MRLRSSPATSRWPPANAALGRTHCLARGSASPRLLRTSVDQSCKYQCNNSGAKLEVRGQRRLLRSSAHNEENAWTKIRNLMPANWLVIFRALGFPAECDRIVLNGKDPSRAGPGPFIAA